jgi:heme exporter protein D
MEESAIQIGLPCVYPLLCKWIGIGLFIALIAILAGIVYSVLKEKQRQRLDRQHRRQRRNHSADK